MSARVARLCPPGQWWYVAVCSDCAWSSTLTWKHKGWAITEAGLHNDRRHGDPSQTSASVDAVPNERASNDPAPKGTPDPATLGSDNAAGVAGTTGPTP